MNKAILKTGSQDFIKNNWNTDIMSVLLKKPVFEGITQKELAEQLEAKKKCKTKLPTWFKTKQIYYPNKLNIEQTSSEFTATYKATLVTGKTLVDITGGFGVDSHFFAKKIDTIIHCEIDQHLSKIAAHNAQILGANNIVFKAKNGMEFLKDSVTNFEWIFADPSRRNEAKGKVFLMKDCLPDIPENLETLFDKSSNILIKTSPLLDITQGLSELKFVKEIHVVAIKNEVKELLWVLEKDFLADPTIRSINLTKFGTETFSFKLPDEKNEVSDFEQPLSYLYEPNSAIMKSGGFKSVGKYFELKKLQEHSHLYTSDALIDFPGRRFLIKEVFPYDKKVLKKWRLKKANVTTRNFPETVANIRRKYQIKDGGDSYLFFTTDLNNKGLIIQVQKV